MRWFRLLFEDGAGEGGAGGGGGSGGGAGGGAGAVAAADGGAGAAGGGSEFNLLEEAFPASESVPLRFRGKPVTEAFEAYTASQKKISSQANRIKELEGMLPKKGQQGISGEERQRKSEELRQSWQSMFEAHEKQGAIPEELTSKILGALDDAGVSFINGEDLADFASFRQTKRNEYLEKGTAALQEAKIDIDAKTLFDLYNERGGQLFSDEDEVMLNRLVKLGKPEALFIMHERFNKAGMLQGITNTGGNNKPPPKQGEVPTHGGGDSFGNAQEFESALHKAKRHFEATGDSSQIDLVNAKLERSRYWRK